MSRVIKAPCVQMVTPLIAELSTVSVVTPGESLQRLVCKAEEQAALAQAQAAAILSEAEQQCQTLVLQARQEAEALRQEAERQAKLLYDQTHHTAHELGYQEGWQAGIDNGQREISRLIDQARASLEQAENIRAERLAAQEQELVDLAVAIARKIVGQELATNADTILSMARAALAKAQSCSHIVLRAAPGTLERYGEPLRSLMGEFRGLVNVDYLGDPLLADEDVLIDTPYGTIDARMDAQLEAIRSAFTKLSAARLHHD